MTITGHDLLGATLAISPPNPALKVDTEVVNANTLRATFDADPSASAFSVMLIADSPGGTSDPISFAVAPSGAPLPRINALTPGRDVIGGNGIHVQVLGENLAGISRAESFNFLPNPTVGAIRQWLSASDPSNPAARDESVVFFVRALPLDPNESVRPGPVEIALRRADGITTNVLAFDIAAPPTDGSPFVSRIFPGNVRRPDKLLTLIDGTNLANVTGVAFDHPGITGTFKSARPDGTHVEFDFDTAPDAVLTGDAATNFHLITGDNRRSSDVGYAIRP